MAQNKKRLSERRILVTGAASGIGRATAELFAEEGAQLGLIDRDAAGLAAVGQSTAAVTAVIDLTDEAAIGPAVAQIANALGGLDGIVNCAGAGGGRTLEDLDPALWHALLAINLTAPYSICRAALPWLRRAPAATIVNIASGQGLLPSAPGVAGYAASKAGLIAFTKAIAIDLAPLIRANVICPGIVATKMTEPLLAGFDNPDDAPFTKSYALKRVARPLEIAQAILFLTSAESSFITGSTLAVDGGRTFH